MLAYLHPKRPVELVLQGCHFPKGTAAVCTLSLAQCPVLSPSAFSPGSFVGRQSLTLGGSAVAFCMELPTVQRAQIPPRMGREASLRFMSLQSEQELTFPPNSSPSGFFVFVVVNVLKFIELILLNCVLLLH